MSGIEEIGGAVCAAFGASAAVAADLSLTIGMAIVGAGVGALYSAFTGGNILKGALYGALGGAALGYGATSLGLGSVSAGDAAAGGAGSTTLGMEGASGAGYGFTTDGMFNTLPAEMGTGATTTVTGLGAGLFSAGSGQWATALASLGGSFMKDGAAGDMNDKKLAEQRYETDAGIAAGEKNTATNAEALRYKADAEAGASGARNESAEKIAAAELEFTKDKFSKEFAESQYKDRADRAKADQIRSEENQSIADAANYVGGNTSTLSPVEANRRRRDLPGPSWYDKQGAAAGQQNVASSIAADPLGPAATPGLAAPTVAAPGQSTSAAIPPTTVAPPSTGILGFGGVQQPAYAGILGTA